MFVPLKQVNDMCEDCGKEIIAGTEDVISFFDSERCRACEQKMFDYMLDETVMEKEFTF